MLATARTRKAETLVVYAAGAVQGIVLVTTPAASTVFTNPSQYGLSSTQYGTLFLPQVITAVTTSLGGAWLARHVGTKRVYLAGLGCGLVAMGLLVLSQFFMTDQSVAYPILLCATAFVGAGFGLTVPALNSLTAGLHPQSVDSSVLILNALLGLGTALAPVFVALFVGLGFWWGLPVLSAILLGGLVLASLRLPMSVQPTGAPAGGGFPRRFWLFIAFGVLYGACETLNGNWAQLDMTSSLGATATQASLALTAFWAMVTLGRVGFAALRRAIPPRWTFHILPFALAAVFVLSSVLPAGAAWAGVLVFGLAGLACSALLPLSISFAQEQFPTAAIVSGGVIAAYQFGYGIAAFGVGPIHDAGVPLPTIFGWASLVAFAMGLLSFAVSPRHHHATAHPAPGRD